MGRTTLNDVSALAGVSRSTASLVLRGSARIPEATHRRVREAMAELGYVYNRQAANMRSNESMTIGLVATDIRNPYFAELTMAVEESVHEAGYTLFIGYSRDNLIRQREQLEAMVQRQVDGILLLPAIGTSAADLTDLLSAGVPIVQIARHFSDDLDYAGVDNMQASILLAQHITSLGSESAVLIGGPRGSSARTERLNGLTVGFQGSATLFESVRGIATANNASAGAAGVAELLDRGDFPDTLICYSDAVAQGIYAELRRRDLSPGVDVSIASFDDVPLASLQVPPLTSVATHAERVGQTAAELLVDRIHERGRPPQVRLVEPTLKVRASTGRWRRRFGSAPNA